MKRTDFEIGKEFFTVSGRWRCTDIGTRIVSAIKMDHPDDPSWYNGPPYAVVERLFDEYDQDACVPTYAEAVEEWGEDFIKAEAKRGESTVVQSSVGPLNAHGSSGATQVVDAAEPSPELLMKVFLDDIRKEPEGWVLVRTAHEAIAALASGKVTHLSLDHDLGDDDKNGTGHGVVVWIEEAVALRGFDPPLLSVHSANVVGRQRMLQAIENIGRLHKERHR